MVLPCIPARCSCRSHRRRGRCLRGRRPSRSQRCPGRSPAGASRAPGVWLQKEEIRHLKMPWEHKKSMGLLGIQMSMPATIGIRLEYHFPRQERIVKVSNNNHPLHFILHLPLHSAASKCPTWRLQRLISHCLRDNNKAATPYSCENFRTPCCSKDGPCRILFVRLSKDEDVCCVDTISFC